MKDEPNETTELWRDYRKARQDKRADNRRAGAERLTTAGIAFQTRNGGAHLVVIASPLCVIDFWPGTGKWHERGSHQHGRGVGRLLRLIKHRDTQRRAVVNIGCGGPTR